MSSLILKDVVKQFSSLAERNDADSSLLVEYIQHFAIMVQWINDVLVPTQITVTSIQDISNGLIALNFIEILTRKRITSAKKDQDLTLYDRYFNMELCLELCRTVDVSIDNISSQDLIERNIPKILLFLSRLAVYYSTKDKKKKKNKGMRKTFSKKLVEDDEDLNMEDVQITLQQNRLNFINVVSQRKALRSTVSPSGTNIPLEELLNSNDLNEVEEPNGQTNNNTNNRRDLPPPPPPRNMNVVPPKVNNENTAPPITLPELPNNNQLPKVPPRRQPEPPPRTLPETPNNQPPNNQLPKVPPRRQPELPTNPPPNNQLPPRTLPETPNNQPPNNQLPKVPPRRQPEPPISLNKPKNNNNFEERGNEVKVNVNLGNVHMLSELDISDVSDDIKLLNTDLSSLIDDMDDFEKNFVEDVSTSIIQTTFNNLSGILKDNDLSDLNVMEVDIDKLKI